jgi:arsenate reductase (thioredoxin)
MITILFVCTGNSCRSQIAEGLLNAKKLTHLDCFSAGISPSRVHPLSIRVLNEIDIDISHHTSDWVNDFYDFRLDFVITLSTSAKENLPSFDTDPQIIHWDIDDPYRDFKDDINQLPNYRETRDLLSQNIDAFLVEHKLETAEK